jgi:purine-binding chemotaxis protein CheW
MSAEQRFSTFHLGDLFFGIEVEQVQEVLRHQVVTAVPLASAVIGGLINLRGRIVTAVDLRRRLQLGDRTDGHLPMNVVLRTDDGAVSLLVDEIGDVVEVDDEGFEAPPDTLKGESRKFVRGVYKLKDKLLLVLNTAEVLDISLAA